MVSVTITTADTRTCHHLHRATPCCQRLSARPRLSHQGEAISPRTEHPITSHANRCLLAWRPSGQQLETQGMQISLYSGHLCLSPF